MGDGLYVLELAKEDFKFSSAHFTLFGASRAELLHGHNYQVGIELEGSKLDEEGLLADFDSTKASVRALCDRLDSHTLIPRHSPHLRIEESGGQVAVGYGDRLYRLPAEDVLILPLVNTSIELLAKMFWDELAPTLAASGVDVLTVTVGETAGQRCAYRAALTPNR